MADDHPRVLLNLRHGEHVATDETAQAQREAGLPPSSSISETVGEQRRGPIETISTPFRYLFPQLADDFPGAHLTAEPAEQTVRALKALGAAMVEQQPAAAGGDDSTLSPIVTYWGQFVDHDLTANTDRDLDISITVDELRPLRPHQVVEQLVNLREPRLNLDSVYGNGPKASGQPGQVPFDGTGSSSGTS